jgi:hypothetical protein
MTQRILGLSGRKQSGKNTATNFITGLELMSVGVIREAFFIDELGKLQIADLFGDVNYAGELDLNRNNPEFLAFMEEHINPYVKNYSFADILKKDVCIKIFGLTHEQCFGTDADKSTPTHLLWENMPGIISNDDAKHYSDWKTLGLVEHADGPMTAREVLQYVGTEIFRKMYHNVWADALIRQIIKEDSSYALISDVRFPNEVQAIKDAGGKVLRLTRNPAGDSDVHESETALDKENFDWSKFDEVLDNAHMNVSEQNKATHDILLKWGWAPEFNYGDAVS